MFTYMEEENQILVLNEKKEQIGEITWTVEENQTISINHTGVSPEYRGHGLAKELFNRAIDKARREQLLVIPACSYVLKQFEKDESFADIWKK